MQLSLANEVINRVVSPFSKIKKNTKRNLKKGTPKLINLIDIYLAKSYFHYRKVSENKIINWIVSISWELYNAILYLFLIFFLLYFIYGFLFFSDFLFLEVYKTFLKMTQNIFFEKTAIILLILISIVNIKQIIIYTYYNILLWKTFFLLVILGVLYPTYQNLYLDHLGFNLYLIAAATISFIFLIQKETLEAEKESSRKQYYYFDLYKTIYERNNGKKNHLKEYLNEYLNFNIKRGNINLLSDDPVSIWNDIFWYDWFVKNIYDILNWINNDFNWSFSIWIVWEWGLWKSSIINLLEQEPLSWNPNYIVHRFNPWNYEKNDLIKSYLSDLWVLLWNKNLTLLLYKYLKSLEWANEKIGLMLKLLSPIFKEKSLEELKNEIWNELKKLKKKLIIIVDDLDRCEPGEVLIMLNLIKNLWNFKNIIYIVSYDKEHIIKLLTDKWYDGTYLEKIINIERFVPIPSIIQLSKYFFKKFTEILNYVNIEKKEAGKIYIHLWDNLRPIFEKENLRFIKKLLNQINIILQLNSSKNNWEEIIKNLTKDDYKNIVLFNYIKLKDYIFFQEILRSIKDLKWYTTYNINSAPDYIKKINNIFNVNFLEIVGLKIIQDKEEIKIYNRYKQNNVLLTDKWWEFSEPEIQKMEDEKEELEHVYKLIKNFT